MKGIYYKDNVTLNVGEIAKIDASRPGVSTIDGKGGWSISFLNKDNAKLSIWKFDSEQQRDEAYKRINEGLGAVKL